MERRTVRLGDIAYSRSGDKGSSANVGVIAYTHAGFEFLRQHLTASAVHGYFAALGVERVERYELPNLGALNFVLKGILGRGASQCLRIDAQGKALGQALLETGIEVPQEILGQCLPGGRSRP